MGYFIYGGTQEYEFDDRTLAHLKAVMTMRLRRQESFLISWVNPPERGGGRISVWLSPYIPIAFRFAGSRPPKLNEAWLAALNDSSHSTRGLIVIPEHKIGDHSSSGQE